MTPARTLAFALLITALPLLHATGLASPPTNAPLNGPAGNAAATGSFDGDTVQNPNDDNHDFTAYSFYGWPTDAVVNTSSTPGFPATRTTVTGPISICVPHTLTNGGTQDDIYATVATAPAAAYALPNVNVSGGAVSTGWTVAIYADSACAGARLSAAPAATATANIAIRTGLSAPYSVAYANRNDGNITPYLARFDARIVATSLNDGVTSNATHDELYSSFIALTKSASVTTTGCEPGTSSSSPTNACPGGRIVYCIDYRNLVIGLTSTPASFTHVIATAGSLQIRDDGTQTLSGSPQGFANWAAFSTLVDAPVAKDSSSAPSPSTTLKYCSGTPSGLPGASCAGEFFATTATAFEATIGGERLSLIPRGYPGWSGPTATQDWQGTLSFTVQVE